MKVNLSRVIRRLMERGEVNLHSGPVAKARHMGTRITRIDTEITVTVSYNRDEVRRNPGTLTGTEVPLRGADIQVTKKENKLSFYRSPQIEKKPSQEGGWNEYEHS